MLLDYNTPESVLLKQATHDLLVEIINEKLDDREKDIILKKFLEDYTYVELAKKYHVSATRIKQLAQRALKKLFKALRYRRG